MSRCLICGTLIQAGEPVTTCPECQLSFHPSCWDDLGGCATYGCAQTVPAEKPPPPVNTGGGWGNTKQCPRCKRTIPAGLLNCRCGARFPHADPMTPGEYREAIRKRTELKASRRALVLLFIFTLTGVLAPVLGPVAGIVAHRKRRQLAGADGTYLAMGYGAAAVGVIYILIVCLLLVGL